jgi:mono/diheme cytochrome c family protein
MLGARGERGHLLRSQGKRIGAVAAALTTLVIAGLALGWLNPGRDSPTVAQGRTLYAEHCAACHGANLEGQPNWQEPLPGGRMPAPPHDASGHTWHHSDRELFLITKEGMSALVSGYESDMPAFEGVLSDDEIRAVLAFIKSTWPSRERQYQDERSRSDRRQR